MACGEKGGHVPVAELVEEAGDQSLEVLQVDRPPETPCLAHHIQGVPVVHLLKRPTQYLYFEDIQWKLFLLV